MWEAAGRRGVRREEGTAMSRRSWDRVPRVPSLGKKWLAPALLAGLAATLSTLAAVHRPATAAGPKPDGKTIFRFDTFGDEQLWTDRLRMHEVIQSALDPQTAFDLGLKIDVDALPSKLRKQIRAGKVDLTDPATTVALIRLDAVVGIVGRVRKFRGRDQLREVGITCALCHSTVDN